MRTMIVDMRGRGRGAFGGLGQGLGLDFNLPQLPPLPSLPDGIPDPTGTYADLQKQYSTIKADYAQAQAVLAALQNLVAHPDQLVKAISIATTHLPPIDIVDPLKPAPPGAGSQVSHALKPRITITFNPIAGHTLAPVKYAPYGDPGVSDWDTWAAVGTAAVALGAGIGALGLISFFKGRKGGLLRRWLARRAAARAGSGVTLSGARRGRTRRIHGRRAG